MKNTLKECSTCRHATLNARFNPCSSCIQAHGAYTLWEAKPSDEHLCYVEGGNAPKVKHQSLADAKTEAERLAKFTMKKVYVVKVVATCSSELVTKWEASS